MPNRIAINGFGRIGKMVHKAICQRGLLGKDIEIAAVTDITSDAAYLAYQLKYDSMHGRMNADVTSKRSAPDLAKDDLLVVAGHEIRCIEGGPDPALLPWREARVDTVIDTTGLFTSREKASRHLVAGARRVLLSNNGGDGIKTIIPGVNEEEYDPATHDILSAATCTANCMIPLIHALRKAGIRLEKGHITIVLPFTASRKVVDTYSTKSWRDGRSAVGNIIPSTVHASKSIADVFPDLHGKITDIVFRVPTPEVGIVEFSLVTEKDTSIQQIDAILKYAAQHDLEGILGINQDEIVSSDILDDARSSIYDSQLTLRTNAPGETRLFRVFSWFDNEWGYSNRLVDLLLLIASR